MYFEDYKLGQVFEVPEIALSKDEIIEFAQTYDPRYFHIDAQAAASTRFGGLIASGFHTLVACWGAWVKTGIDARGAICGIELTNNRWIKPVYPDDLLKGRVSVIGKNKRSGSSSGAVSFQLDVTNQKGEQVLSVQVTALIACKNAHSKNCV